LTPVGGGTPITTESWYGGQFAFFGVPAGSYQLTVEGYLPRPALTVTVPSSSTGLTLDLQQGATVSGTVTDSTSDAPVDGAIVTVADGDGVLTSQPSGTDGSYSITGVDPGPVSVSAAADGLEASATKTATATAGATLTEDFSLPEGGAIAGTVEGPGGGDGNATVWAVPSGGGDAQFGDVASDGSFTIGGLAAGTYLVSANDTPDGLAPDTSAAVGVAAGATTSGVELTLGEPATVEGTITDASTGDPVEGATVQSLASGGLSATTAASDGSYSLGGLPAGTQTIEVSAPGYSTADETVAPAPGGTATENVTLDPTGSVSVTVLDGSGDSLAGVEVGLAAPAGSDAANDVPDVLSTDADGQLAVNGLAYGTWTLLVPGSGTTETFTIDSSDLDPSVDLTVPTGTLTGTVLDASGRPAAGVTVALADATGEIDSTETSSTGTYSFTVTADESLDVVAADPTIGVLVDSHVAVATGSATTAPLLQAGTSSLGVSVADGSGPVVGAVVTLQAGSGSDQPAAEVSAVTDAGGSASFDSLTAGSYLMTVTGEPGDAVASQSVSIGAGTNSQSVVLGSGGAIAGTVSDSSGPVQEAAVVAVDAGGSEAGAALTASDGSYSLTGLAPGTYQLSVADSADPPALETGVSVAAGATTTEDVTMPTGGTDLTVSEIPDQAGGPVPQASIEVLDASSTPVELAAVGPASAAGDPAASTVIGPLAPGQYTVELSAPGSTTVSQGVAVGPSALDVSLSAPVGEELPSDAAVVGVPAADTGQLGAEGRVGRALHAAGSGDGDTSPVQSSGPLAPTTVPSGAQVLATWVAGLPDPNTYASLLQQLNNRYHQVTYNLSQICPGQQNQALLDQLANLLKKAAWAYGGIQTAYDAFFQNRNSGLALAAIQTAQGIGDLLSLLTSTKVSAITSLNSNLGAVGKALTELGDSSTATKIEQAAGSLAADFANMGSEIEAAYYPPGGAGLFASTLSTMLGDASVLLGLISTALNLYGQLPGISAISSLVSFLSDVVSVGQTVQTAYNSAVQDIGNYNLAVNGFVALMNNLLDQLNRLQAQIDDGTIGSTNCPPPPPPPNPPPDPAPTYQTTFSNNLGTDPNGLDGPPGVGSERFVAAGSELGYVIHFQNEPSANASVAEVTVTEPVPAAVAPSSVQLTGFGYGSTVIAVPPGLQDFSETIPDSAPNGDGDSVQVSGAFDPASSTITWTLAAIDPATGDVDSSATGGFLPPDSISGAGEGDGEGYVSFAAALEPGLVNGTTVSAQASIVFDRNAPISTPEWS
ncbi:MAG TPA: carboxypeptidase regulatory-like domain-containing protein, partial [Acidimicrobiales bacterium]|nr:carboxypeptidase regulatory-like domain-containing protein [Acidimicrobiales bacterium]